MIIRVRFITTFWNSSMIQYIIIKGNRSVLRFWLLLFIINEILLIFKTILSERVVLESLLQIIHEIIMILTMHLQMCSIKHMGTVLGNCSQESTKKFLLKYLNFLSSKNINYYSQNTVPINRFYMSKMNKGSKKCSYGCWKTIWLQTTVYISGSSFLIEFQLYFHRSSW